MSAMWFFIMVGLERFKIAFCVKSSKVSSFSKVFLAKFGIIMILFLVLVPFMYDQFDHVKILTVHPKYISSVTALEYFFRNSWSAEYSKMLVGKIAKFLENRNRSVNNYIPILQSAHQHHSSAKCCVDIIQSLL